MHMMAEKTLAAMATYVEGATLKMSRTDMLLMNYN
jgi:hypothetical protein